MAEVSERFGSFMAESVPIRRWRLYSLRFFGLSLGLIAIQEIFNARSRVIAGSILCACVVGVLNYLTDRRSANDKQPTTSD
jgi:hypothetical protein